MSEHSYEFSIASKRSVRIHWKVLAVHRVSAVVRLSPCFVLAPSDWDMGCIDGLGRAPREITVHVQYDV